MVKHKVNPVRWTLRCCFHFFSFLRCVIKNLDMPNSEREKVRNTFIEYITISAEIEPRVYRSRASAAVPTITTPFCIVNLSENAANLWGSHESTAMFAITLGASIKPAWAPTRSKAPSENIVTTAIIFPKLQVLKSLSAKTEFNVFPSVGCIWKSK